VKSEVILLHDIWNPWHGCKKCSEGCDHCYMYFLDQMRNQDGSVIYRTKSGLQYPLQQDRKGTYKIKSGEQIRVCMTSDFFLEEADPWRDDAWNVMAQRPDVRFFLLTKRPQRVRACLPKDWGEGPENIMLNVTCENQKRADERIPILFELPFRHKGIMCAPFIGSVSIEKYLATGKIEQVICGGENYDGARPCHFEWVQSLREQCEAYDVTFCFIETGTNFIKDGKRYFLPDKDVQSKMAYKSGMSYEGKPMQWKLTNLLGLEIPPQELYVPHFRERCRQCGSRLICNGCSDCGKCDSETWQP
jgi:protein gp37